MPRVSGPNCYKNGGYDALNRGIFFNDFNTRRPMTVRKTILWTVATAEFPPKCRGRLAQQFMLTGVNATRDPRRFWLRMVTYGYVTVTGWVGFLCYVTLRPPYKGRTYVMPVTSRRLGIGESSMVG
jgi:hypothetical protein